MKNYFIHIIKDYTGRGYMSGFIETGILAVAPDFVVYKSNLPFSELKVFNNTEEFKRAVIVKNDTVRSQYVMVELE